MNLKVEQILLGQTITENKPVIYSTGVFLRPLEVQINGNIHFVWVADVFDDDTFFDGESISPRVISDTIDELFTK